MTPPRRKCLLHRSLPRSAAVTNCRWTASQRLERLDNMQWISNAPLRLHEGVCPFVFENACICGSRACGRLHTSSLNVSPRTYAFFSSHAPRARISMRVFVRVCAHARWCEKKIHRHTLRRRRTCMLRVTRWLSSRRSSPVLSATRRPKQLRRRTRWRF